MKTKTDILLKRHDGEVCVCRQRSRYLYYSYILFPKKNHKCFGIRSKVEGIWVDSTRLYHIIMISDRKTTRHRIGCYTCVVPVCDIMCVSTKHFQHKLLDAIAYACVMYINNLIYKMLT